MFDKVLAELTTRSSLLTERHEGVAFLRAAKDLYGMARVSYVGCNIAVGAATQRKGYAHCFYSDTSVKQFMSRAPLTLHLGSEADYRGSDGQPQLTGKAADSPERPFTFFLPLRERCGEAAVFGITGNVKPSESETHERILKHELRILANYFHGHVLRINGYDSERELLVSARELDCLKWTAAGKTAWEASVILGISERTVRFHLNMAREKLNCSTTTQAVAKAVANQLIDFE
jgi:DNA-binding CsgD family transcriptional regulator